MTYVAWCAGVLLGLLQEDPLAAAARRMEDVERYSFKVTATTSGEKGEKSGAPIECRVDRHAGIEIQGKQGKIYKKGDVVVYRDGDAWAKFEGMRKDAKEGQKKFAGFLQLLRETKAPHELLADLPRKLRDVKQAEQKEHDCVVFSGTLTDEAARELGTAGRRGGKGEFSFSGQATVWINPDGQIVKFQTVVNAKGKIREEEREIKATRTYELRDLGTAQPEIPDEVAKLLGN